MTTKWSAFGAASAPAGGDYVVGLQSGLNVKFTLTQIAATMLSLNGDTDGTLAGNSDSKFATQKATKTYVDAKVAGLSWKQAVRAATTTAGTLASSFANGSAIDGVTLVTGDRILVKNQATASENGIYTVNASGAPTRATDADAGGELVNATCYVSEGTTLADTQWTCTTNAPITPGTTSLTFAQLSAGTGGITALTGDVTASGAGSVAATWAGGTASKAVNGASPVTLASAATVNIGAAAANDITITGTTPITAFDTIAAGARRTLTFSGALTLTYNVASMILPGAASITTAAGDVAEFESLGSGNWRCIYYTRTNGQALVGSSFAGGTLSSALNEAPKVSIASASTVAIGAAASNAVTITGTTTITAFDTIADGALREVTFAAALTLTHNATSLILPSAANITTAAGDVAYFRSLGSGNWRCVGYMKADGTALVSSGGGGSSVPALRHHLTWQYLDSQFSISGTGRVNAAYSGSGGANATANVHSGSSGKWYAEVVNDGAANTALPYAPAVGLTTTAGLTATLGDSTLYTYGSDGQFLHSGSNYATTGTANGGGSVVNIAVDVDNGKAWFGHNGTWQNSGNPATGANPAFTFTAGTPIYIVAVANASTPSLRIVGRNGAFTYTKPTGFSSWTGV